MTKQCRFCKDPENTLLKKIGEQLCDVCENCYIIDRRIKIKDPKEIKKLREEWRKEVEGFINLKDEDGNWRSLKGIKAEVVRVLMYVFGGNKMKISKKLKVSRTKVIRIDKGSK